MIELRGSGPLPFRTPDCGALLFGRANVPAITPIDRSTRAVKRVQRPERPSPNRQATLYSDPEAGRETCKQPDFSMSSNGHSSSAELLHDSDAPSAGESDCGELRREDH